jgi:hypothetical protein
MGQDMDWVVCSYDGYSSYLLIVDKAFCFFLGFSDRLEVPPSPNMVMMMVDASGQTKVVNWLGAWLSRTSFCGTSTTLLSQLARIAPHKMVLLRSTMKNSPFEPAHSSMALVFLLNFGLQPSFIQSTSTIVWPMPKSKSLPSKVILAQNPISPI